MQDPSFFQTSHIKLIPHAAQFDLRPLTSTSISDKYDTTACLHFGTRGILKKYVLIQRPFNVSNVTCDTVYLIFPLIVPPWYGRLILQNRHRDPGNLHHPHHLRGPRNLRHHYKERLQ
jgi:hypothetical protein